MTKYNKEVSEIVGLDLGDRYCQLCVVNQQGEIVEQGRVSTTAAGMRKRFEGKGSVRIALEAGTHSPWVRALVNEVVFKV
jgi:transposase